MEKFIVRPSGATIRTCCYKTGPRMREQGLRMQAGPPGVFAPVLGVTEFGYVMPVLHEITHISHIRMALLKLLKLWNGDRLPLNWQQRRSAQRHRYQLYVSQREAHPTLLGAARIWYARCIPYYGLPVNSLHGDATLENVMLYGGDPVWLDACTRELPLEAELDAGKLLQSIYGYHPVPERADSTIMQFLGDMNMDMALAHYYLATHLVRLWPHQPEKREWALQTAKEKLLV